MPPPRTRLPRPIKRPGPRPPADAALADELAELRAAVASLQAELKPLPEHLAGLAKSSDAQRKRVDALAATQERARELMQRLDDRLSVRPSPGLWQLATRLRSLLPRHPAPAAPTEPAAIVPAPPVIDWVLAGSGIAPGTRSVLVVLFGLDAPVRETVVRRLTASAAATEPPLLPVFVTESSDFAPMRRARAPFEYLPLQGGERKGAPPRDWQLYLVRRFAGLCAKWQPIQVVAFGAAATRQLALWRASAQLPATVKDLLAVTAEPPLALR